MIDIIIASNKDALLTMRFHNQHTLTQDNGVRKRLLSVSCVQNVFQKKDKENPILQKVN